MSKVEFKPKQDYMEKTVETGDVFIADSQVFIVVQTSNTYYKLIALEDDNRYVSDNIREYKISEVIKRILNLKQHVRYIPKANIKITVEEI